jgi:hypothetical protein
MGVFGLMMPIYGGWSGRTEVWSLPRVQPYATHLLEDRCIVQFQASWCYQSINQLSSFSLDDGEQVTVNIQRV